MRVAVLCALALGGACTHVDPSQGSGQSRDAASLERQAMARTRARVGELLRARDDSGLTRLMTPDAIMDLPDGAVLWSPASMIQALRSRHLTIEAVAIEPKLSVVCDGAAWEAGQFRVRHRNGDPDAEARDFSGGYQVQWRANGDGELRIHRIQMLRKLTWKARAGRTCHELK